MQGSPFTLAIVEGESDSYVIQRLLHNAGIQGVSIKDFRGKSNVLKNLDKYNSAARQSSFLVVLDLDEDADCAPTYARNVMPTPAQGMNFRIAVRSVEAWLMADREGIATFLGIPSENFPVNPDQVVKPKLFLVDLVRRKCRMKRMREDMLPTQSGKLKVGPLYATRISNFAQFHWRPEVAAQRSDSLARCIRALENLKRQSAQ